MFAPAHHPAMKNVGPTRVELGTRTIFNLLGPLSNPASVKRQMIGTFSRHWIEPMAQVLNNLGSESIWVVHGSDGLDEITTSGPTSVSSAAQAANGFPGRPTSHRPSGSAAISIGWPGLTSRPSTTTWPPTRATAARTWSRGPTLVQPVVTTTSASVPASALTRAGSRSASGLTVRGGAP